MQPLVVVGSAGFLGTAITSRCRAQGAAGAGRDRAAGGRRGPAPGLPGAGPRDGAARTGGDRLPFRAGAFDSASLPDVLEHTGDERGMLAEVYRVLPPGGLLVLSVPARHAPSFLDPDNAKFSAPRLHRAVYTARFGAATYRERFVGVSDGLCGDLDARRTEHRHYRPQELLELLAEAGFVPRERSGANLFWRLFQVPALLAPGRLGRVFDAPLRLDGRVFDRANLFLTAEWA